MSSEHPDPGPLYKIVDKIFGVNNIQQPRENFKAIVLEKHTKFRLWNADKKYFQSEAMDAAMNAKKSKWDRIASLLGIVGSILSLVFMSMPVLTVISIAATLITGLRRIAVKLLIYERPYEIRAVENVKFACAWNRSMVGWTSLAVVPLGILFILVPQGYRLGFWIIAQEVEENR